MDLRTVLAYAAMCSIWGTTWLAIKVGLQGLPPITGAGVRFVVAGVVLGLLRRVLPGERGTRAPWPTILLLAATLFGGNYALTYYAETGLASGLVAVLFGTLPFWVFALDAVLLGERVTPPVLLGAVLALAGVAAISLSSDVHASLPFVLATLGAAAVSAYANVVLKQHAATDPFRTLPPAMLLAGIVLTLSGATFEHPNWVRGARPDSIGAILYLAILGSSIAFSINHWLLQRLATWVVGLSALIIPVLAVAVGALLGGETFGPKELFGAALVIAGVWLALRSPQAAVTPTV